MEENNMQSPKKVICCKLKDTEKLMASQSGGAFTAIATAFLKCGGIVYGCEMDNSNQAVYKRIDHIEKLEEIKGSKYVQAKLGNTYAGIEADLKLGRIVLFSGTPCYVMAVKQYFSRSKFYYNLYTVDLICHGVPSPRVYFYGDTVARHKENRQIRKIFYLVVRANSIFFIWNIALGILKRDSIVTYVRKIFTGKSILKFLVLNESPLAGHLWYLGAILYVLVIVLLVDRFNCKKVLYYLTPVLLIADLVFGKYSLLIFHREFPYILVRNFLCVGIPYFCIGNLIREKRCSEKWNRKILQVLIVVFTITSLAERFVLVSAGLNATRDHYLSTTFLAICLFVYTLKSNWHNKGLAVIGRKCSTWLYIIHPIFITAFSVATGKLGIKSIYRCVAPIVTYCATLTFLIVMCRLKSLLVKNNQRK